MPPPLPLHFLKLGGSLITRKDRPSTLRPEALARLAREIATARVALPGLPLIVGHGSGSFGHAAAQKYGTRAGVSTPEGWLGFAEVWRQAGALNRLVVDALHEAGIPAVVFPVSGAALSRGGQVFSWNLNPLRAALSAGLVPVVFGDVVFDQVLGGTIWSTEHIFAHLARQLRPRRILIAGIEAGVWADFPACTRLVELITPGGLAALEEALQGSASPDVTGGMASKVREMAALVEAVDGLEISIFSGETPSLVEKTLRGQPAGTVVRL